MALFSDPRIIDRHLGEKVETVDLAAVEARPIRVVFAAIPTLLGVAEAACAQDGRVPTRWVRATRSALAETDRKALLPLVARPGGFVPDCLVSFPEGTRADPDPTGELQRIAETGGDQLLDELTAPGAPGVAGPWIEVAEDPGRWATRYARALHRTWRATQVEIRGASALIDREIERVGTAVARGALSPLLGDLHPSCRVDGRSLALPAPRSGTLRVAERGLLLVPRLTGRGSALIRGDDGKALTHLAYPIPGATRALHDAAPISSSLEALVGVQRSTVLRQLDRPEHIGQLAEALIAVPGTATHHVRALEAAGLVIRERQGRRVLVRRTARGTALLALYESAGATMAAEPAR